MDLGIKGKVALITGGNRGIGKASAIEIAKEGCNVAITGRDEGDLASAVKEIEALGVKSIGLAGDLETAEGVNKVVSAAYEEFGQIDILFNNAGSVHLTSPLDATDEEWQTQLNIHVMACVRTCRLIIPKMIEQKWGRVINMSSMYGIAPGSGTADYSAAKAAVINYTRSLAMEYSKEGICAVAICPGLIHTEIWDKLADEVAADVGSTRQGILDTCANAASAVKRYARPEEVGKVVAFLASECSSYMTGCAVQVDGGVFSGVEINF